jgi:surface carbohydrate biosynthesis protein (TIGR04326 family)
MRQIKIFDIESFRNFFIDAPEMEQTVWFFLGRDYNQLRSFRTLLKNRIEELDISDLFQKSADELRTPFIEYISKCTLTSRTYDKFSSLVERVPFKSDVFLNICYLYSAKKTIERYQNDATIIVICQEAELVWDLEQTLKPFGKDSIKIFTIKHPDANIRLRTHIKTLFRYVIPNATFYTIIQFLRHISYLSKQKKKDYGKLSKENIVLIHTWASESSCSKNKYNEMYYSNLQEKLQEHGYTTYLILHIADPSILGKMYFKCLKSLERSNRLFFSEEEFINILSILKIWKESIFQCPVFRNYRLLDIDFTWCAYKQNFFDWKDNQILYPLITWNMIKGISKKKIPIRTIIITHENNNWEKTLIHASHRFLPSTTIIGYQHSTVFINYLVYHLSTDEQKNGLLPDYIITNGKYPYNFLSKHGYPLKNLVIGGALRYISYTKSLPILSHLIKHNNRILITLPIIPDESAEILEKVFEAVKGNPELEILVKLHPFLSQASLEKILPAELTKKIQYINGSLYDILPTVNVLVYSTTSTCIEALSFGIPVLKIKSERRVDMDPLGDFQGTSRFISAATRPENIKEELLKMKALEITSREKEEIQNMIRDIFGPVNDETYMLFTRLKGME